MRHQPASGRDQVAGLGITHMLRYHLRRWHEVKECCGWAGLVMNNTSAGFTGLPVIPDLMYEMSNVAAGSGCVQLNAALWFSVSVTKRLISIDDNRDGGVIGVTCVLGQIQRQLRGTQEHKTPTIPTICHPLTPTPSLQRQSEREEGIPGVDGLERLDQHLYLTLSWWISFSCAY